MVCHFTRRSALVEREGESRERGRETVEIVERGGEGERDQMTHVQTSKFNISSKNKSQTSQGPRAFGEFKIKGI